MKPIFFLSLAMLAGSAHPCAAAAAASADPTASQTVSYIDLDLNSPIDRSRLEWRLESAASRLCAEDERATPVAGIDERCFRSAMSDAHRQVGEILAQRSKAALGAALQITILRP